MQRKSGWVGKISPPTRGRLRDIHRFRRRAGFLLLLLSPSPTDVRFSRLRRARSMILSHIASVIASLPAQQGTRTTGMHARRPSPDGPAEGKNEKENKRCRKDRPRAAPRRRFDRASPSTSPAVLPSFICRVLLSPLGTLDTFGGERPCAPGHPNRRRSHSSATHPSDAFLPRPRVPSLRLLSRRDSPVQRYPFVPSPGSGAQRLYDCLAPDFPLLPTSTRKRGTPLRAELIFRTHQIPSLSPPRARAC